jgi:hypothetical protein
MRTSWWLLWSDGGSYNFFVSFQIPVGSLLPKLGGSPDFTQQTAHYFCGMAKGILFLSTRGPLVELTD